MPDHMDRIQERELIDCDLALQMHAAKVGKQKLGEKWCECGEAISELRQNLGAKRCIDCQQTQEKLQR